jgi:hypothetical protein
MALILGRTSKVGKLDVIERRIGSQLVSDPSVGAAAGSGSSAQPQLIFEDHFTGTANAILDTTSAGSSWYFVRTTSSDYDGGPPKDTNTFYDGNSNLVCRCQREAAFWPGEATATQHPVGAGQPQVKFSGVFVATGRHDVWPMSAYKRAWSPPIRLEARLKYPAMPGGWGGMWSEPANKNNTTQGVMELDWSEVQWNAASGGNKNPSAFQHWTGNDADSLKHSDPNASSNPPASFPYISGSVSLEQRNVWLIKSVDIWTTGSTPYQPRYYVEADGSGNRQFLGAGPALRNPPNATGSFQTDVLLDFQIDWRPLPLPSGGSYTLGTNHPLDTDNGPWELLIDYVRVYDLSGAGLTAP